jgi:GTP-binding protein SAR1
MFLVSWFWDTLYSLGLARKKARLVLLGLDNSGKTTLLHMLRDNRMVQHIPTHYPTTEELVMGNITFYAQDVGGHTAVRKVWQEYYQDVDAIIYLVDAADRERINESKHELEQLFVTCENIHIPVLVLGNKVDSDQALSEPQFRDAMGLTQTTGKGVTQVMEGERPHEVFMCSIAERHGYREGFVWLSKFI